MKRRCRVPVIALVAMILVIVGIQLAQARGCPSGPLNCYAECHNLNCYITGTEFEACTYLYIGQGCISVSSCDECFIP